MRINRELEAMLYTIPYLGEQEANVIARVEEVRRALTYATQARRWTGALARMSLARDIQGSNGTVSV